MSSIRSKDTKAEKIVFSELRRRKIYFQKHYKRVLGKPDIALPRKKLAVFIDGEFWHGGSKDVSRLPKDYWQDKIRNNMERDKKVQEYLLINGWKILRVSERDILRVRTRNEAVESVVAFIGID